MKDLEQLTDKQERYAQYLASGMDSQAAAKKAGYSDSFAKVAGFRMKHKPSVAKAIDAIRDEGRKLAVYDLAKAMAEAQEVIEFAKLHKHPTAFFFAVRHCAHLSGLLVEEIHLKTENLDLRGALLEARTRTFGPIDITPKPSAALTDTRPTGPGPDGSGSAGSGPDGNGQPFGD